LSGAQIDGEVIALSRELNRRYGKTYYLASALLSSRTRPYVFALYGFCRFVDDIVDVEQGSVAERLDRIDSIRDRLLAGLAQGDSDDPIVAATIMTIRSFGIPIEYFERFFSSMRQDLVVNRYQSIDDLLVYMDGSAAVIGEMMLPLLGVSDQAARKPARALGNAFQLTNFLRDVGEDLERDRIYLPMQDVERFGAFEALRTRRVTDSFCDLMAFEIARNRRWYADSLTGDSYLHGRALRCVRTARRLYSAILDEIERVGYDVFSNRATVGSAKRGKLFLQGIITP
jgi:phytoene synthase